MNGEMILLPETLSAAEPVRPGSEICWQGSPRWYALRVAPQREEQAEAWLGRRGVYAFHPVLTVRTRRFGKLLEYHRRYLPGYVFARFRGDPIRHRVTASPFILGALARACGEWGILDPSALRQIHAMRPIDAATEAARREAKARLRSRLAAHVGGAAMFSAGAFAGQRCEVAELLADGGVKVRMALFGSEVLVTAKVDDITALDAAG